MSEIEKHQKQLAEFNDTVARAITRAVEGPDEWAMGDDVLRPALQKVIDAKIATIAAHYKHQQEVMTLQARVADLEAANDALRKDHEDEERTWAAATNKRVEDLEHLLGRWCAAEVMCDVPERRKLLDETGSMLLAKKGGEG